MNAVIQMLTVLRKLSDELSGVAKRASPPEMAPLLRPLAGVMRMVNSSQRETPVEPRALREAIAKRSASFGGFQQQDAHEFFRLFLDWVQEDCHAVAKAAPLPAAGAAEVDPITRNFRFTVQHAWKCDGCGEATAAVEDFYDMSLDVSAMPVEASKPYQLADLLAHYFRPEAGIEKTCERCQHKTASVEHKLLTLPEVLVLHMMRFVPDWEKGTYQKCFHPVAVEPEFRFKKELAVPELAMQDAPRYRLQGIVCHQGLGPGQGHYVADTVAADGHTWTRYNDSNAQKFDRQELQRQSRRENVYLAVYTAVAPS